MSHLLTEDQLLEIREAFSLFDKEGAGTIKSTDFAIVMRSLGHNPSEEDLENLVKELDPQGKGTIDFPHFLELMAKTKKDSPEVQKEELMEAFRVFDKDGSGRLNVGILRHIMTNIGDKLTEEELEDMIRLGDEDGNGYVDYERLVDLMLEY